MKLNEYLQDKLLWIMCFIGSVVASGTLLFLTEYRKAFIILVELIYILFFVLALSLDFLKRKKYYDNLFEVLNQLDEKTLISEMIKPSSFLESKILSDVLQQGNKYMNDKIASGEVDNREYREYVEMWVHEIKTPITSANLIIDNDKNMTTLKIRDEIEKIDKYVEQALFYARSTSLEKDFKISSTSLSVLVNESVKKYSKSLIQKKAILEFENIDIALKADIKWCVFIIGQFIANSIKYSNDELMIEFIGEELENGVRLSIIDNGVGISSGELDRIFQKGFTGSNYALAKSTGIGLYLCKALCDKMNIKLYAESEEGIGTKMVLEFPRENILYRAD